MADRYDRQIILPGFGEAGQQRLAGASVLVIGLGGLGSPAATYLAAAGVGRLGLADFDEVETSNLHRQILHPTDAVGEAKTGSAVQRLGALNPEVALKTHPEGVTVENALELFQQYDLILDGTDNFPTRFLANDAAYFAGKPLISGSIFQYEGQLVVLHPGSGLPCYRCLFPGMPAPGEVPNCAEAGVLGALCGIVGSWMAMEAVKRLAGIEPLFENRLLSLDTRTMAVRSLNLQRDPGCPLCGESPEITALAPAHYQWHCEAGQGTDLPLEIDIAAFQAKGGADGPWTVLDVREDDEYAYCRLEPSDHLPLGKIPSAWQDLDPDRHYITLCHHGMRSLKAATFLREQGIVMAQSLQGGIDACSREVDPSIPRY